MSLGVALLLDDDMGSPYPCAARRTHRYVRRMSESESDRDGIGDESLPEDLRPGEANPLAEPLDDEVDLDDLDVRGGKRAEEMSGDAEEDDQEEDESR